MIPILQMRRLRLTQVKCFKSCVQKRASLPCEFRGPCDKMPQSVWLTAAELCSVTALKPAGQERGGPLWLRPSKGHRGLVWSRPLPLACRQPSSPSFRIILSLRASGQTSLFVGTQPWIGGSPFSSMIGTDQITPMLTLFPNEGPPQGPGFPTYLGGHSRAHHISIVSDHGVLQLKNVDVLGLGGSGPGSFPECWRQEASLSPRPLLPDPSSELASVWALQQVALGACSSRGSQGEFLSPGSPSTLLGCVAMSHSCSYEALTGPMRLPCMPSALPMDLPMASSPVPLRPVAQKSPHTWAQRSCCLLELQGASGLLPSSSCGPRPLPLSLCRVGVRSSVRNAQQLTSIFSNSNKQREELSAHHCQGS